VVYGTGVYSAEVGPKDLALERFPDINKKNIYAYHTISRSSYFLYNSNIIISHEIPGT
jgi:hypothetical protein